MTPCLRVAAWVWKTGCTCYYVQVALLGLVRQLCICTLLLLYGRNIAILNGKMLMIALSGSSENQNIKVNQLKFHALKLAQERLYLLHWVPRWANDLPHSTCIRLDARGLMDNYIITVKLNNYIIQSLKNWERFVSNADHLTITNPQKTLFFYKIINSRLSL